MRAAERDKLREQTIYVSSNSGEEIHMPIYLPVLFMTIFDV
jgi:hypothetical protein